MQPTILVKSTKWFLVHLCSSCPYSANAMLGEVRLHFQQQNRITAAWKRKMQGRHNIVNFKNKYMVGKKFETLSDWNDFMKGRDILVINQQHDWYGEECAFIEMVGKNEVLKHKDNKGGAEIKMKVRTRFNTELLLDGGDFMIIEKKIMQRPAEN